MIKIRRFFPTVIMSLWRAGAKAVAAIACGALVLCVPRIAVAQFKPSVPVHFYSTSDGLSQRLVQAFAQDHSGYLWFATWSGLNRFDGKAFARLSVREGLRINVATALLVDDKGRLWVGDGGGGLSVIEYGRVSRTVAPHDGAMSPIRALRIVDDKLYLGFQSHGMGVLDLAQPNSSIALIEGGPSTLIRTIVPTSSSDKLLLQSMHGGLHSYDPKSGFESIALDITALKQSGDGSIVIGTKDGGVGHWSANGIRWEQTRYGAQILDIAFADNRPLWVSTSKGISRFGDANFHVPLNIPGRLMIDRDGVLWVISNRGLGRYLGERFDHFPLTQQGAPSVVFAIRKDSSDRYWFATSTGLIEVGPDGRIIDASDKYGMPPCEGRSLVLAPDESALWLGCFWNSSQRLDLQSFEAKPVFASTRHAVLALSLDPSGWLWGSTSRGELLAEHTVSGEKRRFEFGASNPIYSLALDNQQQLWISVNNQGVFRLDTTAESPQPEQLVSWEQMKFSSVMDLSTEAMPGHPDTIWMGAMGGRLLQWSDNRLAQLIEIPMLADQTIYAIQPVTNTTLMLGTERGLYLYNHQNTVLDYYDASDGFRGIETKNQASFLEDSDTLWIGTGAGATRMDLRAARHSIPLAAPSIVAVSDGSGALLPFDDTLSVSSQDSLTIEFVSVSTRHAAGIEYSHRLVGLSHKWSTPSEMAAVTFSSLPYGNVSFEVKARRAGHDWTAPRTVDINVPTPIWMTTWFKLLTGLALLIVVFCIVRLRTLRVELANRRLHKLVEKRTRSIEAKKQSLKEANDHLTREIQQRITAEKVREEMEERFSKAYLNAPLGMALVDTQGFVFDANPQLREWFWPDVEANPKKPLMDIIESEYHAQFKEFLNQLNQTQDLYEGLEFACIRHDGTRRRFQLFLSPIGDKSGKILYGLLMAQDITESWELTRQLEYQAYYDDLTGLHNRRSFRAALDQICKNSADDAPISLIYMDLDGFKAVNDTYGHAAGDEMLRRVAKLIQQCLRSSDIVSRLGGDEFVAIMHNCDKDIALNKAEDIRNGVETLRFSWNTHHLTLGVSVGLVTIRGNYPDLDELLQRADEACFAAKRSGRNRVHMA